MNQRFTTSTPRRVAVGRRSPERGAERGENHPEKLEHVTVSR